MRSSTAYFSLSCCAFDLPDLGLSSETISTSAGSKPASTVEIRRNVPSSSPAPMMSVSEIAICATTSAFPAVSRPWPFDDAASVGLERGVRLDARRPPRRREAEREPGEHGDADAEPQHCAIEPEVEEDRPTRRREKRDEQPLPHRATASPRSAPSVDSSKLSVSSCRMTRPRAAPSATRIAISRRRTAARASSRFATFAQAISSTSPTITISATSARRYFSRRSETPCAPARRRACS